MTSPSESLSTSQIVKEFKRSRSGIAGLAILLGLFLITVYAVISIPLTSFTQWNNPNFWIDRPQSAMPAWINLLGLKVPEHLTLTSENADITDIIENGVRIETHSYELNFDYDSFPSDFMVTYSAGYGDIQPAVQVDVIRPDGNEFQIYFASLPPSQNPNNEFAATIFSTDRLIVDSLSSYRNLFAYHVDPARPQDMIFSDTEENKVLKGTYIIRTTFYLFDPSDIVANSEIILGGKVYGIIGTDDLRRDLAIGLLWGAPVALFIGLTVSVAAVFIGLIYGVMAGYKGNRTDEGLMRINDVFYSLPTLPLLVILSVTVGRSIFLITGFLVIFGWVGMAKISRSLALQIKSLQYIEAARLMGQSDTKIIFKHIIPQLLPLTFASIAIAVPGAILGEAALSFLGLGDPSIPTWGQILHDAHSAGAMSRGLWWWIVPPGMMIAITGLAFVLIGNALDNIVNVRARRM
ncbi:MAG: ABC transporter permease [Thermoproteota archaeon]|nr:ABC transporter permease [Thermoproteota archaeon]